jgi:hypothetical protein
MPSEQNAPNAEAEAIEQLIGGLQRIVNTMAGCAIVLELVRRTVDQAAIDEATAKILEHQHPGTVGQPGTMPATQALERIRALIATVTPTTPHRG